MSARKNPVGRSPKVDCWCGASDFRAFGPDYLACVECGTLVSQKGLSLEELRVDDDESDFYGKKYWLDHQESDLNNPGFQDRTRSDLPERNLHWLRTLLRYRLPPARVIELGCAHGSFVALMRQGGFDASGVEMSPWVVSYGRKEFGINVQVGPVEKLNISKGSLDVIAMMDVMEHLPDPVSTISHCLDLLRPDGILLVQMPNYVEELDYQELRDTGAPFLEQLKADEHLFLYSTRATVEFFRRLGANHINFEPAIFAHYDMCFVVSRTPLRQHTPGEIEAALLTPKGRVALAMLDMKERYDQAPILQERIDKFDLTLAELYERSDRLTNERNLLHAQLKDLGRNFSAVEADRADRGKVIETQGQQISGLEGENHLRLQELEGLYVKLDETRNERSLITAQLEDMRRNFFAVEKDRIDRGNVIDTQGQRISDLEGECHRRLQELIGLYEQLEGVRNERNLALAESEHVHAQLVFSEGDRDARGEVIEIQGRRISELESRVHHGLAELDRLHQNQNRIRSEQEHMREKLLVSDESLVTERQRAATLEQLLASAESESEQVRVSLEKQSMESARLREEMDVLERRHTDFVGLHNAQREALERRLWWKLGRFLKVL